MIPDAIETVVSFFGLGSGVATGLLLMLVLLYWRRIATVGTTVVGYVSTGVILIATLGALSILGVVDINLDELLEIISTIWNVGQELVTLLG